ncbi:MAG: OmpA family protein [Desulfarculus sp.]|nr:OmpA family protein [Desulfarculus sp.]
MKPGKLMAWAVAGLLMGLLALPAAAEDVTNAKDHPLFSRLPRFDITHYEHNYDAVEFPNGPETSVTLEGQKTYLDYWLNDGSPRPSSLQIIRNYSNAVKKMGGEVVHERVAGEGTRQGVYKLNKSGKEIWVWVLPIDDGQGYRLTVLEVGEMPQEVTSGELMNALEKDGRVALYLNFDTNKHDLKPEARPVIEKVVALLKENPGLRLSVDGHTDNQGDPQRNKRLSEQRAQAVVKALVRAGVDQRRLSARGFGQEVPLTGNDDEEGRAQNRRVELVRQ